MTLTCRVHDLKNQLTQNAGGTDDIKRTSNIQFTRFGQHGNDLLQFFLALISILFESCQPVADSRQIQHMQVDRRVFRNCLKINRVFQRGFIQIHQMNLTVHLRQLLQIQIVTVSRSQHT